MDASSLPFKRRQCRVQAADGHVAAAGLSLTHASVCVSGIGRTLDQNEENAMHPIGRRPAWAGVLFATTTLLAIAAPRQAKGEALELKNCEILLPTGKCIKWAANTAGL